VQPPAKPRMTRWAYMVGSQLPESVRQHPENIDVLSPAWFHLDDDGDVYGDDIPSVTRFAKEHNIKLVPIVANGEFDAGVAHDLVSDGGIQTHALKSMSDLVKRFGYAGINIDFENLYLRDRKGFSAFMSNVDGYLHREGGKLVTLALPSKTQEMFDGFAGAFDYAALAPNVDLVVVMTYDEHYAGGEAGPVASIGWVEDVVKYVTKSFPANKVLLGLPFYGYNWNVSWGGQAAAMGYSDIVRTVFANGAGITMDPISKTPYTTYSNGSGTHQIWFENSTSLGAKVDLAQKYGLAGWGAWRIGLEDNNFWSILGQK